MKKIALLGAGVMGSLAASRLLEKGYPLCVFDPFPQAQERARKAGPAKAAEGADMVIMFLPGPAQIRDCVAGENGVLAVLAKGSVIVDHSTVDPETTKAMAALAQAKGVGYLDAPVLGRPAAVGKWALPTGGDQAHIETCREALSCYAGNIIPVGDSGAGNAIKLLNQLMFGAINAMTAEMMAIADKLGVSPKLLYETITASKAGTVSNLFGELGKRIADDDYENPAFSVNLLIKDVALAVDMAKAGNAPPVLGRTINYLNELARAQGLGSKDTSVMWKCVRRSFNP